ncbi:acyltransferase family protein [Phormidesmis priestleyi]
MTDFKKKFIGKNIWKIRTFDRLIDRKPSTRSQPQRLAWLEGIRIFAAVLLLWYHSQLLFTKYSYTPQPTGLIDNLQRMTVAGDQLGQGFAQMVSLPVWFGFQFVDVFVLISGFSLVLSLKGKPLEIKSFLKKRFLRILLPFWTVAWLAYPILWTIAKLTNSYAPDAWHTFAGMTFPLLFDYGGDLLLPTNGPWWFVPLILSFAFIFPFLWHLSHRWGARNLVVISIAVTFIYRAFAVYVFGGHPTYVVIDTPAGWQPFLPFIAKLSTFVLGIAIAKAYLQGKGMIFWSSPKALLVGIPIYVVGFIAQFYKFGWIFDDFLIAIGLTLCCMVVFRTMSKWLRIESLLVWLGLHSYSYFLIHNFVVDRTLNLVVRNQLDVYYQSLPVMAIATLLLALLVDRAMPWLQRSAIALWNRGDALLARPPQLQQAQDIRLGDTVSYLGSYGWKVVKIEQVVHDEAFYLCRIFDGNKALWVNEHDLKRDQNCVSQARS